MRNVLSMMLSIPRKRRSFRIFFIGLWLFMASMIPAMADENNSETKDDAKELSGMSIVGNDDAPKSLYIVPWKSSEVGVETAFDMLLNDTDVPVDRDVFMRQLSFYQVSTADPTSLNEVEVKKD